MRITSIRARLTIWNVGILAVGLLAVLLAVNLTVRSYLVSNIDRRLERISTGYERMMARRRTERQKCPLPEQWRWNFQRGGLRGRKTVQKR